MVNTEQTQKDHSAAFVIYSWTPRLNWPTICEASHWTGFTADSFNFTTLLPLPAQYAVCALQSRISETVGRLSVCPVICLQHAVAGVCCWAVCWLEISINDGRRPATQRCSTAHCSSLQMPAVSYWQLTLGSWTQTYCFWYVTVCQLSYWSPC